MDQISIKLSLFLAVLLFLSDFRFMKVEGVHPPSQVIQTNRVRVHLPGPECHTDDDCAYLCGPNKKCLDDHCYCSPPFPECSTASNCRPYCGSCPSTCDRSICVCSC
ncbi:hypothetical protein ACHQM5_029081 [Ranunculus cassubicifolius]